jgi:hypothetical protein
MPVESGVKRLREQEFDWAVEQKRVQILLDTTVSSAANATTESGGEAEIAGGGGVRHGAATRSLRSARGAAHSGAARHAVGGEEGYDLIGQKDLVAGEFENFKRECKQMRLLANCDRCEA